MKIVIDLDEKYYNDIKNSPTASNYSTLYALFGIRNGTPLPENATSKTTTLKEYIENRIAKLKEDKDRAEHCEFPDWIYAEELQSAIFELQQIRFFIENQKEVKQ